MNRSTTLFFCLFTLIPSFFVSSNASGYVTTGMKKPNSFEGQRTDGRAVISSAFKAAPGEHAVHLSDPKEFSRYNEEMDHLIRRGLTLISTRLADEARIELTQAQPMFRTFMMLHKGDESDSIEFESQRLYKPCQLENSIKQSGSQQFVQNLVETKRGAGYLKTLDKLRKFEALALVAEFLAELPSKTTSRSRRNHQSEFVRNFVEVNSLPVHVLHPQPSGANMSIVFLADFVSEAGYPEFFQALLGIPEVAAAFAARLQVEFGVRPQGTGITIQDFNVARSVHMSKYRMRHLVIEEDCSSAPGALLISALN